MNALDCSQAQARLFELIYDERADHAENAVQAHVADCAACRATLAELRRVAELLDEVPALGLPVDVAAIRTDAAAQRLERECAAAKPSPSNVPKSERTRENRWWRRPIVWKAAAAAAVIGLMFFKLEFQVHDRQLVVRWGSPPGLTSPDVARPPQDNETRLTPVAQTSPALERRLSVVSESLHAISDISDERERELRVELNRVSRRLAELERQSNLRWAEAERTAAALYAAQFGRAIKDSGD